jgi:hypothetical protein
MKALTVRLQIHVQKLHQLSQHLPSHSHHNKGKKIQLPDSLLLQASNTMTQMLKLTEQKSTDKDSIETCGKLIVSEIRDIWNASNEYLFREAKRKIQQILSDARETTDSTPLKFSQPSTQLSETSDSNQWDEVKSPQPVSLDQQSLNENVILRDKSCDVIRSALQNAAVTEDYQYEF